MYSDKPLNGCQQQLPFSWQHLTGAWQTRFLHSIGLHHTGPSDWTLLVPA